MADLPSFKEITGAPGGAPENPVEHPQVDARSEMLKEYQNLVIGDKSACPPKMNQLDCLGGVNLADAVKDNKALTEIQPLYRYQSPWAKPDVTAKADATAKSEAEEHGSVYKFFHDGLNGTNVSAGDLTVKPLAIGAFWGVVYGAARVGFNGRAVGAGLGVAAGAFLADSAVCAYQRYTRTDSPNSNAHEGLHSTYKLSTNTANGVR